MDQITVGASGPYALVTTGVTVFGIATGLSYEVLFAGFAGALCSLSFLPAMKIWRRIWSLFSSTLFAGYFGPLAAALLSNLVPGSHPPLVILMLGSYLCGLGAQWFAPAIIDWAKKKATQKLNEISP